MLVKGATTVWYIWYILSADGLASDVMMSHEDHGISIHQQHNCFFNRWFGLTTKKTSKLCITIPFWAVSIGNCWISFTKKNTSKQVIIIYRDHSGYGFSQWVTTLHFNVVSHWLSPYPERSLTYQPIGQCFLFHIWLKINISYLILSWCGSCCEFTMNFTLMSVILVIRCQWFVEKS